MIKLTTTQAKAVACKIRERVFENNERLRKQLREDFIASEDYKNKQREIHETIMYVHQTSVKSGLKLGICISGCYYSGYVYDEKDVESVEKAVLNSMVTDYVNKHDPSKCPPSEDKLVTDLIFESLTSEGIEELMDKFIEPYL